MDRVASVVALLLLTVSVVSGALLSASAAPLSAVPTATAFTLELRGDRTSAEMNDTILYTLWLNITSGGQLQFSRVNVSLEPDLILQPGSILSPADCALSSANATFAEWGCTFLRSGRAYAWSIPVEVSETATVGRNQSVVARAVELSGGGSPISRISSWSVWILVGVLHTVIYSDPPAAVQPRQLIYFTINATNEQNATDPDGSINATKIVRLTAYNVTIRINADPQLRLGPGIPEVEFRFDRIPPGLSFNVTLSAIVEDNATAGAAVGINVTLYYRDVSGRDIGPDRQRLTLTVRSVSPFDPNLPTVAAVAAFALLAILGTVTLVPALGERNLAIDEVFLMHRSGILIQHLSHGPGLRKDDDLVASMFVAIQEFVRDSFNTKATLDELSFSGRKAAVLRGKHIVLAALLSKGSPRYLFPQMKAVERAIEKTHGEVLSDWDGRVSRLDQAGPILNAFLRGGYRRYRGWRRQ